MTPAHRPRTVAIVQARTGSVRLPAKVLLDLGGQPVLVRVVERTRRASLVDEVVVATTLEPEDEAIEALCRQRNYPCFRGSLHDVLDRYYQAARHFDAGVIVRITADCPLIDPTLIDEAVDKFRQREVDFAANRLPPPFHRTYPIGLDVEVCTFAALARAWREADQPFQREHVMPYLYEGLPTASSHATEDVFAQSPRGFRLLLLNHAVDYGTFRWAVDTPQDLEAMRQVYAHFHNRDDFSWQDVLRLYQQKPELARINADVVHKSLYDVETRQGTLRR
jgi:spore coat polysaccharide biosynthesis protein SpsF